MVNAVADPTPEDVRNLERAACLAVATTAREHIDQLPQWSPWREALTQLAARLEGRPPPA